MKLYNSIGPNPRMVRMFMAEKGFDVPKVEVDLRGGENRREPYATNVNPAGQCPALELDDGTVLTEGPAIVQYLADLVPERGLAPPNGTVARYQLQGWLNFVSTELHKSWSPLWNKQAAPEIHAASRAKIDQRFGDLERPLTRAPFLMGEGFTVADAYLFTIANWGQWTGVDLAQWPWVRDHHARVAERPTVKAALAAERALK